MEAHGLLRVAICRASSTCQASSLCEPRYVMFARIRVDADVPMMLAWSAAQHCRCCAGSAAAGVGLPEGAKLQLELAVLQT
jgi:hypothetical protein